MGKVGNFQLVQGPALKPNVGFSLLPSTKCLNVKYKAYFDYANIFGLIAICSRPLLGISDQDL